MKRAIRAATHAPPDQQLLENLNEVTDMWHLGDITEDVRDALYLTEIRLWLQLTDKLLPGGKEL